MGHGNSGITQGVVDRIFIVPLVETSIVSNVTETAQWRYDNIYKYKLSGTKQQWKDGYYTDTFAYNAPLCMYINDVLFKDKHHVIIHYLGLDPMTESITPYISDKPPGYFASKSQNYILVWTVNQTVKKNSLRIYDGEIYRSRQNHKASEITKPPNMEYWDDMGVTDGAINENGWTTDAEFLTRINLETKALMESEYFGTHMDDMLVYNKNVPNKIDQILLCPPHYIGYNIYSTSQNRSQVKSMSLAIPSIPAVDTSRIEPVDHTTETIIHEYTHHAFYGLKMDGVFGRDGVNRDIPDMYIESGRPLPPAPYEGPTSYSCIQSYCVYQVSPMMSKLFGFIGEERIISESGTYEIDLRSETFDHIIMRCPNDKYTYCVLTFEKWDIYDEMPHQYDQYTGINAYFIRMLWSEYSNIGHTFSNVKGMPVGSYTSFEMTQQNGYADLSNEEYDGARQKRKSVLNDFISPSGILASYNGEYERINGAPYASVVITLAPNAWDVPPYTVTGVPTGSSTMRVYIDGHYSLPNADYINYQWSVNPDMSDPHEVSGHRIQNYRLNSSNLNEAHACNLPKSINGSMRYIRLAAYGDNGVVYSNIVGRVPQNSSQDIPGVVAEPHLYYVKAAVLTAWSKYDMQVFGIHLSIYANDELIKEQATDIVEGWGEYIIPVTGLSPDTSYVLRVAYDWADAYGPEVSTPVVTLDYVPGVIQISSAIPLLADSVAITHTMLDEATEYMIAMECDGGQTLNDASVNDYIDGVLIISCPYPGKQVSIVVAGKNGTYESDPSASFTVSMPNMLAPVIYQYDVHEWINASINWNAPTNIDGASYEVEVSLDGFVSIESQHTALSESITINGLPENVQIWARCRAAKWGEYSPYSNIVTFMTGDQPAPSISSIIPLYESARIKHNISVGESYLIQLSIDAGFVDVAKYETSYSDYDGNGYAEILWLLLETCYHCRVRRIGEDDWSAAQSFCTLPLPEPTGLVTDFSGGYGEGVLYVSWDASPISDVTYDVEISMSPDMQGIEKHDVGDSICMQVDGEWMRQRTIYLRIHAKRDESSAYSSIMKLDIPAAYDNTKILDISADYESVLVKHYTFLDTNQYSITIRRAVNDDLVYEGVHELSEYDENGYWHSPGGILAAGVEYVVSVSPVPLGSHEDEEMAFTARHLLTPCILRYSMVTHDSCGIHLIRAGSVQGEYIKLDIYALPDMETIKKTYIIEEGDDLDGYYELTGLQSGASYYVIMQSCKNYDGEISYSEYPSYSNFMTYCENNKTTSGVFVSKIIDLRAEKCTSSMVMITWKLDPYNLQAPFRVLRSFAGAEPYEVVAEGSGTAYVDDVSVCMHNDDTRYIVESLGDIASVQMSRQADNWLLAVAGDYLWQLMNTGNATKAISYCAVNTHKHCPECYSEDLGKIIKTTCSTCDGSGTITNFVGPIPFLYSIIQRNATVSDIGNMERDVEIIYAWTANYPLFKIGDIVINKDHAKFIVQEVPDRKIMHSTEHNDEFVAKQQLSLRRLKDSEYPSLTYYENIRRDSVNN